MCIHYMENHEFLCCLPIHATIMQQVCQLHWDSFALNMALNDKCPGELPQKGQPWSTVSLDLREATFSWVSCIWLCNWDVWAIGASSGLALGLALAV
jgi:hypothetical protein